MRRAVNEAATYSVIRSSYNRENQNRRSLLPCTSLPYRLRRRDRQGIARSMREWRLPFNKEFYVLAAVRAAADSRGALTPSNVPRTFSVRLNRFTGTMQADLRCIIERRYKATTYKEPAVQGQRVPKVAATYSPPMQFPQYHRRCCV